RLGPLVEASGGAVTWIADDGTPAIRKVTPGRALAGRGWIGINSTEGYLVTGATQQSLLPALLALLLLLGTPFLHARFNAPDATILPVDVPSREAHDVLAESFGIGEFSPLVLAIRTSGPATDPATVGQLYDYSRRLAADPRVTHVEGLVDIDPRLGREQYQLLYGAPTGPADRFVADVLARTTRDDLTAFTVYTAYGPNAAEGLALVREIRDPHSALAPPAGMSVLVGGGAAEVGDVVARMGADFPRSGLFIVLTTFVVLFVLLRSLVLPLKAIVMNTLSIAASFGALVWIFQDGNLSAILGFTPLGFVETTLPVILFCVLFGLSMDYEVFLLSRMKEAYDQTGDNTEAVVAGMERSGRIVTSAALIVVVVAGSFAFADIVLIKAVGLGVAIAVALDASIVRALLVPSTMRLLGDWNWWLPERLRRFISTRLPTAALLVVAVVGALALAGCSPGGRLLGVDPVPIASPATPSPKPSPVADPQPVSLPRDEAPHDRLTEWWYYTGHLAASGDRHFGFEFVIFRAERGSFPVTWASHLALTDEAGDRFVYEQRSEIGPQVDQRAPAGFDLALRGSDDRGVPLLANEPWLMSGANG
ncbi:MAG TPA: MMPL family transporter, partial [Candidatus Limnocylindrales bacterium]